MTVTRIILYISLALAVGWTGYWFYSMQTSERAKTGDASSGLSNPTSQQASVLV